MFDRLKEAAARLRPPKQERAPEAPSHGETGALFGFWFLVVIGSIALIASTWMLVVFIAGAVGHVDWAWDYRVGSDGQNRDEWFFESQVHLLMGIGLFGFCACIALFNATWLELQRTMTQPLRAVFIGLGIATALFMISGSIVVQQRGTDARQADIVQEQGVARVNEQVIRDEIQEISDQINNMTDRARVETTAAIAASIGVAQYDAEYLNPDALRNSSPARRDLLQRARGAAVAADELRARREALREQLRNAATTVVAADARTTQADTPVAALTAALEDLRKPITAILGELLAMVAFAGAMACRRRWQLAKEQAQPPTVEAPAPVMDESRMVPDLRDQAPVANEVDAYFEDLNTIRSEAAKKGWKKRKMQVQTKDGAFETAGIVEERDPPLSASDNRVARVQEEPAPTAEQIAAAAVATAAAAEIIVDEEPEAPVEDAPAELTDEELEALYGEGAEPLPNSEGVMLRQAAE